MSRLLVGDPRFPGNGWIVEELALHLVADVPKGEPEEDPSPDPEPETGPDEPFGERSRPEAE